MSDRVNFADPEYEPTDDDLRQLSREAFAHVRAAHEAALVEMRARIEKERVEVLRRVHARLGRRDP